MKSAEFNGKAIQIICHIGGNLENDQDPGPECEELERVIAQTISFYSILPSIGDAFPTGFGSGYATIKQRNFTDIVSRVLFNMEYE